MYKMCVCVYTLWTDWCALKRALHTYICAYVRECRLKLGSQPRFKGSCCNALLQGFSCRVSAP